MMNMGGITVNAAPNMNSDQRRQVVLEATAQFQTQLDHGLYISQQQNAAAMAEMGSQGQRAANKHFRALQAARARQAAGY
jgi:hypothetical protein